MLFVCSECSYEVPTDTRAKDADDIPIVPINLDFKSGVISFACPQCNHLNQMQFISNIDMKKRNNYPKIKVVGF